MLIDTNKVNQLVRDLLKLQAQADNGVDIGEQYRDKEKELKSLLPATWHVEQNQPFIGIFIDGE